MKKLIVITGPTAVGKTKFAIELAKNLNTEIISADSRQIYKEMKIGTARPTDEELKLIKHFFISTHSVTEYYNASKYEFEAIHLIEKLFEKHELLIIAGGSGLYIDAILYGIDDLPEIDPQLRHQLQVKFQKEGLESIRLMLKTLDPVTYEKIDLKNPKRILKALEVSIQTGKPYSSFLTGKKKQRNFNHKIFVLNRERESLYDRINKRVEIMVEQGLVEEARKLYPYRELTPLKTVGYRELFDYFENKISLSEAIDLIKRNTRKYARRQLTWFRRYPDAIWVDVEKDDVLNKIIENL